MKYLLEGQESERLTFRLLEKGDFDIWLNLFHDKTNAVFLGMDPKLTTHQLCQLWFDKVFNRYENDLGGMNVLIDKKTQKLVGQCGLLIQTIEDKDYLEIGYSVLPEYCNQGFASEAAQKCKNYGFENNFSEFIISIVHIENIGSKKVALKNGMKIDPRINNFKGMPVEVFRIEKENWSQNQKL